MKRKIHTLRIKNMFIKTLKNKPKSKKKYSKTCLHK